MASSSNDSNLLQTAESQDEATKAKKLLRLWIRGFQKNNRSLPFMASEELRARFFPDSNPKVVYDPSSLTPEDRSTLMVSASELSLDSMYITPKLPRLVPTKGSMKDLSGSVAMSSTDGDGDVAMETDLEHPSGSADHSDTDYPDQATEDQLLGEESRSESSFASTLVPFSPPQPLP